uniref:Glycosyltransferase n=1 Tax=Solanum tuberosum TaxID=4113 RepID=M1AX31_SOLTU
MAVSVAATGVILGWPFSILAFLPLTIYSLVKSFKPVFLTGVVTSIVLMVSLIISY